MGTIAYRNLRNYKYQLVKEYSLIITVCPATDIILPAQEDPFIRLKSNGELTIRAQYAWDGPSGPTIDTKNFMRGSLIHDALYQLIRERILEPQYRKHADNILRTIAKMHVAFSGMVFGYSSGCSAGFRSGKRRV